MKKSLQKFLNYIDKHWKLLLLVFTITSTLSTILFLIFTPNRIPNQDNTWHGLTPGYPPPDDIVERLGEPTRTKSVEDGILLEYESDYPSLPQEVHIDDFGEITFIKERPPYDENHTLTQYTAEYGEPDLTLHTPNFGDWFMAYVFLDEGVVVIAHNYDKSVFQKWYFIPTTREAFMLDWQDELSTEEHGPETFE